MISVYTYLALAIIDLGRSFMNPVGYAIGTVLIVSAIAAVLNLIEQAKKDKGGEG